ncbi:uncharacterized protein BDZ99DRAFT_476446 [Mytilinidion resinicola]|uniref:Uncharacterized protein n=1 Tax=Mytilinidion resinicola TaxID=574789 RepID=A0A6A6YNV4_9PEZI|nr:uncharacterized protein BDZ99DRAFT_476446 [Mytilinidion resinicola]KAF2810263.1 hypothetical protein BDZ99DRAFT_476446 [Mytilinidion resinicola]
MLFYPVNLPLPSLVTATLEVTLGLTVLITARSPFSFLTSRPILVSYPTTARIADANRFLGMLALGLGMSYFAGSYMPLEQNQVVHASVPIRLGLAGIMFGVCAVKGRKGMSEEGFWELIALGVFDVVGSVVVALSLGPGGVWDGKVRGWESL